MEVLDRYESIVDDFEAFTAACERPLSSAVRVNTIKTTVERAREALDDEGIAYDPVDWYPGLLKLPDDQPGTNWPYFLGWIYGQEEVSAIPAEVLDPDPGERVWDACAAPGSKTSQLAALMDDEGVVVATDSNLGRLSALRSHAERLGITNVAVTHEDARNHSLKPFEGAEYDRALVDVPCSCEGTIRKNFDALDDWDFDHVQGIAGVQKGVLRRAVQATRAGGIVVYSTCTFAPEENEEVLDYVLEEEENCRLVDFEIPLDSVPGITEWDGRLPDDAGDASDAAQADDTEDAHAADGELLEYHPSVAKAKRIYPHHNDTGGFFCAKLEVQG